MPTMSQPVTSSHTSFDVAPLDAYAARITSGIAYLGGLLMLPLLFAYLSNMRWGGLIVPSALALPLAVWLLLCYGQQPIVYLIEERALVIKRRWWRALRVPFDDIAAASVALGMADIPRRGLRFAFNAGIFGYQGPFRLDPLGHIFFLATNRERLVSVARHKEVPLMLSPTNPRAFVDALNDRRSRMAIEEMVAV